jgi:MFS family permease
MNERNQTPQATAAISSSEAVKAIPALHRHRVFLTVIACGVYSAFALTANGWGPLLAPLATRLSFSFEQVGLLFVVWSIGYLPGALIGGSLLDIYGPRTVFSTAFLFILSGMGLILLAVTFHLSWLFGLVLCAGFTGIGGGTIDASANAFMSSLYPQKRGATLNLFTALYPLSAMLIALIEGAFFWLFHNDPRPSLLFILCLCLCALLLVFLFPRVSRNKGSVISSQHFQFSSSLPLLKQGTTIWPLLLPLSMAILLTTGFTATIRTWTPVYLHITYGQAPALAALLSGLMNGLIVFFRLLVSLIVDRIGTRSTILLGLSVALGGLFGTLGSRSDALAGTLFLTVAAIGLTPLVATFMALGNERVGRSHGSVTGIILFVTGISNVAWSWVFGVILNRAGSFWAITCCLVPLICGFLVVFALRSDHKRKEKKDSKQTS